MKKKLYLKKRIKLYLYIKFLKLLAFVNWYNWDINIGKFLFLRKPIKHSRKVFNSLPKTSEFALGVTVAGYIDKDKLAYPVSSQTPNMFDNSVIVPSEQEMKERLDQYDWKPTPKIKIMDEQ